MEIYDVITALQKYAYGGQWVPVSSQITEMTDLIKKNNAIANLHNYYKSFYVTKQN